MIVIVVTHAYVQLREIERLLLCAEEQRNFMRVKANVIDARRLLLHFLEDLKKTAA
jgi:hypothetical protein